jgi:hypothetical protein
MRRAGACRCDFFDVSPIVLEMPYDHDRCLVVDRHRGRIKVVRTLLNRTRKPMGL